MKHSWKKSLSLAALAGVLMVGAAAATVGHAIQAELRPDIAVKVNGVTQDLSSRDGSAQYAIVYNGTTYLPVRALGEGLGMTVGWNGETQTVSLTGTGKTDAVVSVTEEDLIGVARAKAIALKDAGLSESAVTIQRARLDRDDDRQVYDVEFTTAATEYDYEIDALTGAILQREQETRGTQTGTAGIGMDKAKALALKHAGLTADQVRFTKSETDWDDGRLEYELEFVSGGVEYEYTVNAADGAILDAERDK